MNAEPLKGRSPALDLSSVGATTLPVQDRGTGLARWAQAVSRDANATTVADVEGLRAAGFDDAQIFAITCFVALRVARLPDGHADQAGGRRHSSGTWTASTRARARSLPPASKVQSTTVLVSSTSATVACSVSSGPSGVGRR